MCSVVCQGLQACLEPRFADQRTLLGSPKTHHYRGRTDSPQPKILTPDPITPHPDPEKSIGPIGSDFHSENKTSSEPESGTWTLVQSLNAGNKESNSYVHPLARRSSSTLSKRSLELCTESLGCESGTELTDTDSFSSSYDSSSDEARGTVRRSVGRKTGDIQSFPPPLTSISGSNSVHIRSHRQDGRLVLKAVTDPSTRTCFQAQRSDGRLKLFLINGSQSSTVEAAEEEEIEETIVVNDLENKQQRDISNMNNSNNNSNGEMGVGQFQRPSRCKEGGHGSNKGMLPWEPPCWVATS